jgi:hypothetical protein
MIIERIREVFGGYSIATDSAPIMITTSRRAVYKENFGFTSNVDDLVDMLGANVTGISYNHNREHDVDLSDLLMDDMPVGTITNLVFITIATDSGNFIVTFYNQQDGDCDHEVEVSVGDVNLFTITL